MKKTFVNLSSSKLTLLFLTQRINSLQLHYQIHWVQRYWNSSSLLTKHQMNK